MKNIYKTLLILCCFLAYGQASYGQVSLTNASPSHTISFDNTMQTTVGSNPATAFTGIGFEPNTTIAGRLNSNAWAITGWNDGNLAFGGTRIVVSDYTRGTTLTGNVTTAGIYALTTGDRLYIQPGGSDWAPGTITLRIQNNGTSNITSIAISYDIYVRNDQGRSNSFNFSHSTDDVTYTPEASLDYTSTAVADGTPSINLVGTSPSRTITISSLNIAPSSYFYIRWSGADVSGTGSRDEFGLDDIAISATFAASNTISAPNIPGLNFLTDCTDTEDLTVTGATSMGIFNTGNQYIAQLSDGSGSFASPVATASVSSTSNTVPDMIITIPAGTPSGTGYRVRIISTNPSIIGAQSIGALINQGGTCVSTATDYFRSRQTGNWNVAGNWQSSTDNINWITATLVPDNSANVITIQTGHNITITDVRTFDQTAVNGTLTLNAGTNTITIANGTGTDLTVNNGGVINVAGTDVSNIAFTGTVAVGNGGILRYTSGGGSNIAQTLAGTSTNTQIVYANGGIFDWNNTGSFASSSITYFSTSAVSDAPIFRVSQNTASVGAGAGNPTTINGVLEVNGTITFQNAGTKTFRNGITGTGTLTQDSGCGQFLITGTTATLAGAGTIALSTNGMSSTATTLTLNSNKTINGNTFTITSGTFETLTNTLSGTTNFTLASGATLRTANVNGLDCIGVSGTETFTAGANYVFNGTALQAINNPTGISAQNITINNSAGATLSNNLTVTGTLTLTAGDLDLNGRDITLSGALANLSENRLLNHLVKDNTATNDFNQGGALIYTATVDNTLAELKGTGLYLQRTAGSNYDVSVARRHYRGAGASAGGKGIKRIYQITVTSGTVVGTNTTMRIEFASDELIDVIAPFVLYKWSASGWQDDVAGGFTDGANGTGFTSATGINAFSHWTVGSESAPLPITLLGLTGERVEGLRGEKTEEVRLEWATASEINNKGFEVEMSKDGLAYQKIAFVDGKGNSNTVSNYQLAVSNAHDGYYRLKQVDFDGKFSYSPIVFVEGVAGKVVVYPNPSNGTFTVVCGTQTTADKLDLPARLLNAQGKEVWQGVQTEVRTTGLPAGTYFLHTTVAGKTNITKVVIQ